MNCGYSSIKMPNEENNLTANSDLLLKKEKLTIDELATVKPSDSPEPDKKPVIEVPVKSSMEILSELFECFDAKPPLIIKKEKADSSKKNKKGKKKHKHKDKKHKKKDKKHKRAHSSSEKNELDLAEILIKQEKESSDNKIKIEGTDLSLSLNDIKTVTDHTQTDSAIDNGTKNKSDSNSQQKGNHVQLKCGEDGEISSDTDVEKKNKKRKHKSNHDKSNKKKRSRSRDKISIDDLRNKIKHKEKYRSKSQEKRSRSKSRDDDFYKTRDNDFYKYRDDNFHKSCKDDGFYKTRDKDESRSNSRDRERLRRDRKSRDRDKNDGVNKRRRGVEDDIYKASREKYNRERERNYRERLDYIDKKKLLEIARKNAIQMMKSGSLPGALTLGPQAQEKVIAAIRAGGKTIEELTDFCKTLSKQEAMGDLSSGPDENGSDSDADRPFHHPFQIKDRPTSITMNIKNSVPLPIKSTQERTSELRMQFPVSSGQHHRKTESEWVPVSPKKSETVPPKPVAPLAIEEAPSLPPEPIMEEIQPPTPVAGPQIFPEVSPDNISVDIGSIVSQRLSAMRKLQENPNDVQALSEIYKSNKEMQNWAQSKQQPGQFTGTTGAQILSHAELSSGFQAWARKDQLQTATPVSGGMGMHLLQKMGWRPGEGLGKEKTGALEPLLLEVKLDKKGLVANEEQRKKKKQQTQWGAKTLQNKHPVSLLGEYASKKKLGAPEYTLCFECGPDHKKNFLFKVNLNGVEYKPNIASPNKKEAKAAAASVCLQQMGLLPTIPM